MYIENKRLLKMAFEGKINLYKLPTRVDQHFKIIDTKHVFIATKHDIIVK